MDRGCRKYPKFCVLGRFIILRLAPISPRRGSAQQFPPSRGVMGARSPHSKGVSLIC